MAKIEKETAPNRTPATAITKLLSLINPFSSSKERERERERERVCARKRTEGREAPIPAAWNERARLSNVCPIRERLRERERETLST